MADGEPVPILQVAREDLSVVWQLDQASDLPPWSPADYERLHRQKETLILVAGRPGSALGFLCGRVVAEEAEILKLVVTREHRCRGIGRRLVREFLRQAREQACRSVYLDVRESNSAALHLYESLGFQVVGRRKDYYREPAEDALLMARHRL